MSRIIGRFRTLLPPSTYLVLYAILYLGASLPIGRRGPMCRDFDLHCGDLADLRRCELRPRPPVERKTRQVQDEVEDACLLAWLTVGQPRDEPGYLRPGARQSLDRGEKRVEQRGPHCRSLVGDLCGNGPTALLASWPGLAGLARPSTSTLHMAPKAWMAGRSPVMTGIPLIVRPSFRRVSALRVRNDDAD